MPKITTRLQTIPFYDTVAPQKAMTLVSKRINVPFKVKKVSADFAPGTQKTLLLEFYVSPDDSAPTAKPLTGINVLATLGHSGIMIGDDRLREYPVEMDIVSAGYYLKVFAENTDTEPHTIDAQVLIELQYFEEEKIREEKPKE